MKHFVWALGKEVLYKSYILHDVCFCALQGSSVDAAVSSARSTAIRTCTIARSTTKKWRKTRSARITQSSLARRSRRFKIIIGRTPFDWIFEDQIVFLGIVDTDKVFRTVFRVCCLSVWLFRRWNRGDFPNLGWLPSLRRLLAVFICNCSV